MTAIVGGGITGLSIANLLQQRGVAFELYEAVQALRPVGAGIILSPNALYIYDQLGLLAQIEQAGFPLRRFDIADAQGRLIQQNDTQFAQHGQEYHAVAIHRGALQQILLGGISAEHIHLNHALSHIDLDSSTLHFANGTRTQADYILACDGIHSKARQSLFPDSRLRYSGQTCWRGVATTNLSPERLSQPAELWGNGLRFGYVPIGPTTTYWYATAVVPADGRDNAPEATKASMLERYNPFAPFVSDIIVATPGDTIVRHDLYELRKLAAWSRGRTLLLGDAAHAMTPNMGQGAAQGIEDAWAIANCLTRHADPPEAFAAYRDQRYAKATRVTKLSWQIGQLSNPKNALLCRLRNGVMRLAPAAAANKQKARLFSVPARA